MSLLAEFFASRLNPAKEERIYHRFGITFRNSPESGSNILSVEYEDLTAHDFIVQGEKIFDLDSGEEKSIGEIFSEISARVSEYEEKIGKDKIIFFDVIIDDLRKRGFEGNYKEQLKIIESVVEFGGVENLARIILKFDFLSVLALLETSAKISDLVKFDEDGNVISRNAEEIRVFISEIPWLRELDYRYVSSISNNVARLQLIKNGISVAKVVAVKSDERCDDIYNALCALEKRGIAGLSKKFDLFANEEYPAWKVKMIAAGLNSKMVDRVTSDDEEKLTAIAEGLQLISKAYSRTKYHDEPDIEEIFKLAMMHLNEPHQYNAFRVAVTISDSIKIKPDELRDLISEIKSLDDDAIKRGFTVERNGLYIKRLNLEMLPIIQGADRWGGGASAVSAGVMVGGESSMVSAGAGAEGLGDDEGGENLVVANDVLVVPPAAGEAVVTPSASAVSAPVLAGPLQEVEKDRAAS